MSSSQPIEAQSASPASSHPAPAVPTSDAPVRDADAGDSIQHEDQDDEPEPEPELEPGLEPEEEEEDEDEDEADEELAPENAGQSSAPSALVPPTQVPTIAPSKGNGKSKAKPKPIVTDVQWGQTRFATARVQRLLKADENIDHVSKEATFLITIAAELFVKNVAERAYAVGRLEKRRYIAYNDVQNVISKDMHWSYLKDVVPDPVHYSDAIVSRENLARQKANVAADFFGVPPAPGLERNPEYEAGPGMFLPDEYEESDVEMREV